MLAMTRPALRPLTAATAALVAGAAGAVPAAAAGIPSAPLRAAHPRAPHSQPALMPPVVMPAKVVATAAREPGAGVAGLADGSAAVVGDGVGRPSAGDSGAGGRPWAGVVRARGPPA
jgi:hypothetical protein